MSKLPVDPLHYLDLKKNIQNIITLEDCLWEDLMSRGKLIDLKKNEYLLKAGVVCNYGYFINHGCLLHMYLKDDGEQVVIGFSEDRRHRFVSSSSYFTREESTFEILAVEDCQLLAFSKADLEKLSYENRDFSVYYQYIMSQGLTKQYEFTALRLSLSSEELLALLQRDFSDILNRVSDKYIARFMGISQEWFCKIKKK